MGRKMILKSALIILICFTIGLAQLVPGEDAPGFTLPDTNGNPVSLESYRGKVVLLNFFTTWCVPCSLEVPQLQDSIWSAYDTSKVAVVGIDYMETSDLLKSYVADMDLTYHFLQDTGGHVYDAYQIRGFPNNVILDARGTIVYSAPGFDIPLFIHLIDSLLQPTGISETRAIRPEKLKIASVYPNPFNPQTTIAFVQPQAARTELRVFDITGRVILRESRYWAAGDREWKLYLTDRPSGVYFFELASSGSRVQGRLYLVK